MLRLLPAAVSSSLCCALAAQCAIHDLNPGSGGSRPTAIVAAFGQEIYFSANLAPYGVELYKWDASSGLNLLADIHPGTGNSNPQDVTPCCTASGPRILFSAFYPGMGAELWSSDGTAAGTMAVADILPGSSSSSPRSIFACHDRVFFTANDGVNGAELWVSDGTPGGTYLVADINAGAGSSLPEALVCFDGRVFLTAYTPATGRELWVSDGTSAGTYMVLEIHPGSNSPSISSMVACGGKLFFSANDGSFGGELWTTDGTANGTFRVADISPNTGSSSPLQLTCCGDTLYFTAQTTVYGRELWKSDGTTAGTVLAADVRPGPSSAQIDNLVCAGDRLFFSAYSNAGNGNELWVSDGTQAGTFEVADINPGSAGSFPQQITPVATGVCFYGVDAAGAELWFSDGTAGNTFRVCDIDPGSGGSIPQQLTVSLGRLFFAANHPTLGNEMFEVQTPGAVVQRLGHAGLPNLPTLVARDGAAPVLGTTVHFDSTGPAGALGVLVAGPSGLPAPIPPGFSLGACDWAGTGMGLSLVLATSVQQAFAFSLAIPNQAALTGTALNLQTIWLTGSQPPVEPSNGLQIVVGGPVPM